MAHAVWTGSISFGLVNIGVRMFPATEPKDVRFHLVDERGQRVRYRRFVADEPAQVMDEEESLPIPASRESTEQPTRGIEAAPGEEREVDYDDLMRGYETDEGLVVLSPDEVEAARPQRSRMIEIEDFVELEDVDPVFYEKSYILAPQRDAENAYSLLLRAMEQAGRVGIGRFVLRTKPHLVAIRPADGVLGLETMFFGDEVRDARALAPGVGDVEVSQRELQLAQTLIETLKIEWDPARYADTYREELLRRIAEKEPVVTHRDRPPDVAGGRVEELMEALKASVEQAKKSKKARTKRSA
jgi:DNA end-binding protein Ku